MVNPRYRLRSRQQGYIPVPITCFISVLAAQNHEVAKRADSHTLGDFSSGRTFPTRTTIMRLTPQIRPPSSSPILAGQAVRPEGPARVLRNCQGTGRSGELAEFLED